MAKTRAPKRLERPELEISAIERALRGQASTADDYRAFRMGGIQVVISGEAKKRLLARLEKQIKTAPEEICAEEFLAAFLGTDGDGRWRLPAAAGRPGGRPRKGIRARIDRDDRTRELERAVAVLDAWVVATRGEPRPKAPTGADRALVALLTKRPKAVEDADSTEELAVDILVEMVRPRCTIAGDARILAADLWRKYHLLVSAYVEGVADQDAPKIPNGLRRDFRLTTRTERKLQK